MGPPLRKNDRIRVAVQALVVALCCIGVGVLLIRGRHTHPGQVVERPTPTLAVHQEGTDWPQFGGGPAHLGRASGALADRLSLAWTFKTSGPVKSSAAIVEGRVYVGSSDANVYALDLETGKELWSARLGDAADAPVCVQEGTVFAGCADGFLYALDANDGSIRWKYQTGGQVAGGPNWVKDPNGIGQLRIVVGSYDGSLHCVDAKTGSPVWTYKTDNYVNGSPAVADGLCLTGGCDARIHVVSAQDGHGVTTIDTGSYIAASAAAWEGQVFVGNYNGDFVRADPRTSQIVWRCSLPDTAILSSPAIGEGVVFFGARDQQVHCLRQKDGSPVWTFKALGQVDSSPVLCDGKVVVGSDDGRLYMIRAKDGSLVWSYPIGKAVTSSPAISHGVVLIGCDDGTVYAFGQMK
jgi:eukaryotic-like serine/threonine-protein kinase